MRWETCGRRAVYLSDWVEVWLDDVEVPGGQRFEHHVLRFPRPSVAAVVLRGEATLLLWRHRFITDSWGWEIPAGWTDHPDEGLEVAVRREIEEETGHRAAHVEPMTSYHALSGISPMRYTVFLATEVTRIGDPTDGSESTRVEWVPLADIPRLAAAGHISDGPSLTALSYYLGIHRAVGH
ncbi:MAG: NUDIX hydrolase [Actinobacteria bacterium]|nr:NUDIX hydrolase [Actinomycetota bacterium]MBI3687455.1 NUDIX hydrolase [Actinomycetota bacterium]